MSFILHKGVFMDNTPLVSIVIPVYNGSNYLREAIDSALSQTYKNIEIIVVNDGSCDNGATEKIALSYGDKIRYFYKENGGVSSALNFGIEKMCGEYFSWLSHDDKYEFQKIEKQIQALEKIENKETVIVCSSKFINSKSQVIFNKSEAKRFADKAQISWEDALKNLFNKGSFNGCAFLINKKIFDTVGFFDEHLRYVQDILMWANIFLNEYPLFYMHDELVMSRIHDSQLTQTGKELFYKESKLMAEILLPKLFDCKEDILLSYANYNATYNNILDLNRQLYLLHAEVLW